MCSVCLFIFVLSSEQLKWARHGDLLLLRFMVEYRQIFFVVSLLVSSPRNWAQWQCNTLLHSNKYETQKNSKCLHEFIECYNDVYNLEFKMITKVFHGNVVSSSASSPLFNDGTKIAMEKCHVLECEFVVICCLSHDNHSIARLLLLLFFFRFPFCPILFYSSVLWSGYQTS